MDGGRLIGVDVARCVALFGMAATHIFPGFRGDLTLHPSHEIASGRASALFAVLAGVSLVLVTRSRGPLTGRALWSARSGTIARAAFLLLLGLLLGAVDSPPLVILAYYAVLFGIGAAFLGLPGRTLAWLAAASAVVTPALSHVLRQYVEVAPIDEPGGGDLFVELLLTGTYPALTWTTYLLAGMAVGRADLRRFGVVLRLLVIGAVAAVGAKVLSRLLLDAVGGEAALSEPAEPAGYPVGLALDGGLWGTTPRIDADWLAVSAPHTGTTFDLAHTTGTALLVIAACLLLVRLVPRALVMPFAAAGSMTLTLYSLHVLALAEWSPLLNDDRRTLWFGHLIVALALAGLWRTFVGKGPLEIVAAAVSRAGRALVGGSRDRVAA